MVGLKVGTPIGASIGHLPSLGGAKPQEGGEITQAWIVDSKVYPEYQCPKDGGGCLMRQWLQVAVLL